MKDGNQFRRMKALRRRLLLAGAVAALTVISCGGVTYWAARQPPSFYHEALRASPLESARHGERFEDAALALHNAAHKAGRWEAAISADEINGWLATDLAAKFPGLLPAGISDPRVAIDGDTFRVAIHYQRGAVDTVLSISGEAYLTAQTNEIAIRLESARAGLVPIPLGRVIEEVNERVERGDVNLRWTEIKGSPVALVRLPVDLLEDERRIVLDRLDTRPGQILLAGRTESFSPRAEGEPQPATAVQSDKEIRQR